MESIHEVAFWLAILVNFDPHSGEVSGIVTAPANSKEMCEQINMPRLRQYAVPEHSYLNCQQKNYQFAKDSWIRDPKIEAAEKELEFF